MNAPVLSISDLSVRFATNRGVVWAVRGITLSLDSGKTLGVVGESGSGKSVLARTIMCLLPASAMITNHDRVLVDGVAPSALPPSQRRRIWGAKVAMVFQDPMTSLTPVVSIGRQIMEPLRFHKGLGTAEARSRAVELLRRVGIPDPAKRLDQYPHNLSGGMRQRVMIAIALSCDPGLLLCDEPTTALDVTVQHQVLNLLQSAQRERGTSMVLITHDLGIAAGRTDDIAVMYGGTIVELAATRALFRAPRHPYTVALMRSIPRLSDPPRRKLEAIPGKPPVVTGDMRGCAFAPRCPCAQSLCREERPRLRGERGHLFACHFPVSPGAGSSLAAAHASEGSRG